MQGGRKALLKLRAFFKKENKPVRVLGECNGPSMKSPAGCEDTRGASPLTLNPPSMAQSTDQGRGARK